MLQKMLIMLMVDDNATERLSSHFVYCQEKRRKGAIKREGGRERTVLRHLLL